MHARACSEREGGHSGSDIICIFVYIFISHVYAIGTMGSELCVFHDQLVTIALSGHIKCMLWISLRILGENATFRTINSARDRLYCSSIHCVCNEV